MFLLILILVVGSANCIGLKHHALSTKSTHFYWFNKDNPKNVGNSDTRWDFCDLKCLYLQRYYPNKDFVVLVLTAPLRQTFAACYVKTESGYTLWNKVVTNTLYEKICGKDYKDWANMGKFTIKGVYGEGVGNEIAEDATYS